MTDINIFLLALIDAGFAIVKKSTQSSFGYKAIKDKNKYWIMCYIANRDKETEQNWRIMQVNNYTKGNLIGKPMLLDDFDF